ncbi:MAG: 1-acyl-sn-glycerol-3-phosphate acyltransferase [Proteobacteria bacterium]|nr:1-acyl-sn-glycerol-3-phosphate acyltransferase [Pseudomonadota bacterium]MBU4296489.1 1-acyl-sn-glycerol-3-phosphate acyltransferase [Pseudomonadota bacterium]MCG2749671.1 1-acyl-sn-glycerol-3-phosphate acyltransferase [Desulfobulbaceae bacterium]
MRLLIFIRGVLVLILIPFATFVTSLLAILFLVILRGSEQKAQVLPRTWARIILAASGVKVKVIGLDNIDKGRPYIFAANHQSQFDIFTMQGCFDFDFRWLAKKELFQVPLFGRAMHLAGYISIDRSHGRQALKSLKEAAERIAAGTSVILFPEGTRSLDGKLHDFKSGGMVLAIKSGVPLIPVGISGTYEILPKGSLLVKPGQVTIRVGKPIDTKAFSAGQKHELATMIQGEVARLISGEA